MREIKFRAWDGDDSVSHKDGEYTYVKADWHPMRNHRGYVKRHRLVLEAHLGEYLPLNSIVHHKNGDKRDDRVENLEYHPDQRFHAKRHDTGDRNSNRQFVAQDPIFSDIKFRLFNKNTRLYEVRTLGNLIKTTFRNSQFSCAGRFTGLFDKTGKEIYEFDIVDAIYLDSPEVVLFKVTAGGPEYPDWIGWNIFPPADDTEILGNVYENPELLEKPKEES